MTDIVKVIHPKSILLTFENPHDISLKGLVTECGYSKPTEQKPAAVKDLPSLQIAVANVKAEGLVVVSISGDLRDWGAVRFAIDNAFADLAAAGVVLPLPADVPEIGKEPVDFERR